MQISPPIDTHIGAAAGGEYSCNSAPWPWIQAAIAVLCLLVSGGYAQLVYCAELQMDSIQLDKQLLDHFAEWESLLYMHRDSLGHTSTREDGNDFFLDASGKTNPRAELITTMRAISAPSSNKDDDVRCRFPARAAWINRNLYNAAPYTPRATCHELDQWINSINAESVTLIYAGAHLGHAESMFGHLMLRFERPPPLSPLNSHTLTYAANIPADASLEYVVKGITGGYQGVLTILPFYRKLREYGGDEARDIWEYQLNLSPDETRQLLYGIWELRQAKFDYFFADENCAYFIEALLANARPGTSLAKHTGFSVLPTDVLQSIHVAGLVKSRRFIPSQKRQFLAQTNNLSNEQVKRIKTVTVDRASLPKNIAESPGLGLRLDYLNLAIINDIGERDALRAARKALITDIPSPGSTPTAPPATAKLGDANPADAHRSTRVGIQLGTIGHQATTKLSLRLGFHDTEDPPTGYPSGAQLVAGGIDATNINGHMQISAITIAKIRALNPINRFFSPASWDFTLGAQRALDRPEAPLEIATSGGLGFSLQSGKMLSYGLARLIARDVLNAKEKVLAEEIELGVIHHYKKVFSTAYFTERLNPNEPGIALYHLQFNYEISKQYSLTILHDHWTCTTCYDWLQLGLRYYF